jgi:hypothetical protein
MEWPLLRGINVGIVDFKKNLMIVASHSPPPLLSGHPFYDEKVAL